jgi:hypothetical protein
MKTVAVHPIEARNQPGVSPKSPAAAALMINTLQNVQKSLPDRSFLIRTGSFETLHASSPDRPAPASSHALSGSSMAAGRLSTRSIINSETARVGRRSVIVIPYIVPRLGFPSGHQGPSLSGDQ